MQQVTHCLLEEGEGAGEGEGEGRNAEGPGSLLREATACTDIHPFGRNLTLVVPRLFFS